MIFASHFLSSTWYRTALTASLRDINGTQLNLGDNVKIEGVVTRLIPSNNVLGNAVVQAKYGPSLNVNTSTLNLVKE